MMDHQMPRLGVQLYTLREHPDDLLTIVPKLAAMGYVGVELYGGQLDGVAPDDLRAVLDDHGVVVTSSHISVDVGEGELDALQAVGIDTVVVAFLPPDDFADAAAVAATAARLDRIATQVGDRGLTLGYHNHFWELQSVIDDRPALVHLFEQVDPAVIAEIDVYWAQVGGADPVALVAELGDRVRFLHVKDGPADDPRAPMVAVGDGVVDIPAVLQANPAVRWHLVELDRCATDMEAAVAASARHLRDLGLTAAQPA